MTTDAAWGPGAASVVYVDSYRPLFLVSEDGESQLLVADDVLAVHRAPIAGLVLYATGRLPRGCG